MTANEVLKDLYRQDIDIGLTDDGINLTVPAGRLTPAQRQLVLTHKAELIALLVAARRNTAALIEVAMRACDHHGDGPDGRRQMRADCEATPPHLAADLAAHFSKTYPRKAAT